MMSIESLGISKETVYNYDISRYQKKENYPIYTVQTMPNMREFFKESDRIKSRRRDRNMYYNISTAFDIETTTPKYRHLKEKDIYKLEEQYLNDSTHDFLYTPFSFMYHWQFAVNGNVFVGRTWEEFVIFMNNIIKDCAISLKNRLVIYVHNLAYEFQFIYRFFEWHEVFARAPHKIMKAITEDGIEFRCSYFLSNKSLKAFCEDSALCVHGKQAGDLDYKKIRYFDDRLTLKEFRYTTHDVLGLCECIDTCLQEDNIDSIPMTNTGYVRRYCRQKCLENKANHQLIKKSELTPEEYQLARRAFRGGDTHANRRFTNKVVSNVRSFDITSSYPFVMMTEQFPVGKGKEVLVNTNEDLWRYTHDYAAILEIEFFDLEVKEDVAMPYLDKAHAFEKHGIVEDNGRIYKADYICTTITSVDLDIIFDQYRDCLKWKVRKCYIYETAPLPLELRQAILFFFDQKTRLKGVDDYNYLKSKNRLNGIFGMSVTAIDQDDIIFFAETGEWGINNNESLTEVLKKYYNSYNSFLSYLWGVFITAYARRNLHRILDQIGMDAVYIDTDCIKYIGDYDHLFEEDNKRIIKLINSLDLKPISYDKDGKIERMGVWDYEGIYPEFKTLGAKKYCATNIKDKYKWKDKKGVEHHIPYIVTVSGMNKEKASKKIKNIAKDFKIGLEFTDVGRTVSYYNNNDLQYVELEGRRFLITPNIGIVETTYTMGISETYSKMVYDNLTLDEQEYIGVKYKKKVG